MRISIALIVVLMLPGVFFGCVYEEEKTESLSEVSEMDESEDVYDFNSPGFNYDPPYDTYHHVPGDTYQKGELHSFFNIQSKDDNGILMDSIANNLRYPDSIVLFSNTAYLVFQSCYERCIEKGFELEIHSNHTDGFTAIEILQTIRKNYEDRVVPYNKKYRNFKQNHHSNSIQLNDTLETYIQKGECWVNDIYLDVLEFWVSGDSTRIYFY